MFWLYRPALVTRSMNVLCLQNVLSLMCINSIRKKDSVCVQRRQGPAVLLFEYPPIHGHEFTVQCSVDKLVQRWPHVFFLFGSRCVCGSVGACLHVRIPSVDPSVNFEGILKSITFSQQILLQIF